MKIQKVFVIAVIATLQAVSMANLTEKIVYFTGDNKMYVMNAGEAPMQVPLPENISVVHGPHWSKDGSWITFNGGVAHNAQVYVVKPDGSELRMLTNGTDNLTHPSFSPDSSKISFSQVYGPLYTINFDGTNLTQLPVYGTHAEWSPVANKIAHTDWGFTYDSDIFVYDIETGTNTLITPNLAGEAFIRFAWSPDGQKLAASRRLSPSGYTDIWVINADGTNAVNRTAGWTTSSEDWPSWSPDGQHISFMSNVTGDSDIWYMSADGTTNPVNLTATPSIDEYGTHMAIPEPATLVLLTLGGIILRKFGR